ncbi:MAG: hypothetical protein CMO81_04430 [Waddliaceae bacterium]|nr:hypothetical protein [Waddliaceae bacterium]
MPELKDVPLFATCGVKALLVCDHHFLVLSKPAWVEETACTWNDLPGGRVNYGESCPQKALRRELEEEIGCNECSIIRPLHMATVVNGKKTHVVATIFHCVSKNKKVALSKEHSDYCWLSLNEIHKEPLPEWIKEAALLLLPS